MKEDITQKPITFVKNISNGMKNYGKIERGYSGKSGLKKCIGESLRKLIDVIKRSEE